MTPRTGFALMAILALVLLPGIASASQLTTVQGMVGDNGTLIVPFYSDPFGNQYVVSPGSRVPIDTLQALVYNPTQQTETVNLTIEQFTVHAVTVGNQTVQQRQDIQWANFSVAVAVHGFAEPSFPIPASPGATYVRISYDGASLTFQHQTLPSSLPLTLAAGNWYEFLDLTVLLTTFAVLSGFFIARGLKRRMRDWEGLGKITWILIAVILPPSVYSVVSTDYYQVAEYVPWWIVFLAVFMFSVMAALEWWPADITTRGIESLQVSEDRTQMSLGIRTLRFAHTGLHEYPVEYLRPGNGAAIKRLFGFHYYVRGDLPKGIPNYLFDGKPHKPREYYFKPPNEEIKVVQHPHAVVLQSDPRVDANGEPVTDRKGNQKYRLRIFGGRKQGLIDLQIPTLQAMQDTVSFAYGILEAADLIQENEALLKGLLLYQTQVKNGTFRTDANTLTAILQLANINVNVPQSERVVPDETRTEIERSLETDTRGKVHVQARREKKRDPDE